MKKIIILVTIAFAICFISCKKSVNNAVDNSLNELKERGEFVLGLDDSFPPMGFRNEAGEIVGFDIDIAKELATRLGVNFKATPIDWDAKEMELSTGKIDCIWNGFTATKEREAVLSLTQPYWANKQVLVVKNTSNITSLSDMAGKRAGVQTGSSAQEAIANNEDFAKSLLEQVMFKDNVTALNDLDIGGVDGVVMDSVVAEYSILETGKPFVIVGEPLSLESYVVAFRKEDIALRDAVDEILLQMKEDGTIPQISSKWFGNKAQ